MVVPSTLLLNPTSVQHVASVQPVMNDNPNAFGQPLSWPPHLHRMDGEALVYLPPHLGHLDCFQVQDPSTVAEGEDLAREQKGGGRHLFHFLGVPLRLFVFCLPMTWLRRLDQMGLERRR